MALDGNKKFVNVHHSNPVRAFPYIGKSKLIERHLLNQSWP
jgi:hypothetical protein